MKGYIIILLLAGFVCGESIMTFGAFDINTRAAIGSAAVTLENSSLDSKTNNTETNGFMTLHLDSNTYNLSAVKLAYVTYEDELSLTTESTNFIYMTPLSDSGIIKLRYRDQTLSEHELCFYYEDNDRLHGCYYINDTIILLVNKNYTIRPMTNKIDIFTSPTSMKNYTPFILMLGVGAVFIVILASMIIYFVRKAWKGQ